MKLTKIGKKKNDIKIQKINIMNNLNYYIFEKLRINKDIKLDKDNDDYPYPIKRKSGEKYLWFQWWEYLNDNGPMSKRDLLTHFNLQPTSYSTMFADLSKRNIIVPVKGKLVAKDPDEWIKK